MIKLEEIRRIAVVGASANRKKWGYKIFKQLLEKGFEVYPINPKYLEIEGHKCFANLRSLPVKPDIVIMVVKPNVAKEIVKECYELGIEKIWFQPGSESKEAIEFCKRNGLKAIYGQCFLISSLE